MNKTINIDGVEYNLVPVSPAQEVTKENKFKVGDLVKATEKDWGHIIGTITNIRDSEIQINARGVGCLYFSKNCLELIASKPQTKYRKNGALVYPPENIKFYYLDLDYLEVCQEDFSKGVKGEDRFYYDWLTKQGVVFDNEEACQIWADKLKTAYALKQRIVESESEDEYLENAYVYWDLKANRKGYQYDSMGDWDDYMIRVSTRAKDILMADDVSDEDFKAFIEVFSL
jgi:hypothetical protein